MQWIDRVRTDPTLRKLIHSDSTEELVHIEEVSTNVVTNGTMVGGETLNVSEKNIGTYGEDTYDNTQTYEINDLTIYEGLLYKCISAITTPENFNSSHWVQVNLLELKANTFDLANVAFSGDYSDLSNTPNVTIVESGSNENGNYLKYSDGTMMCHKKITKTGVNVSTTAGALYRSNDLSLGNFPQTFSETPTTSISLIGGYSGFITNLNGLTNSSIGSIQVFRVGSSTNLTYIFYVFAIGKYEEE